MIYCGTFWHERTRIWKITSYYIYYTKNTLISKYYEWNKDFFFISGQVFYAYVSMFICRRWSNQNGTLWQETYPTIQKSYVKLYCDVKKMLFLTILQIVTKKMLILKILHSGNLVPFFISWYQEWIENDNQTQITALSKSQFPAIRPSVFSEKSFVNILYRSIEIY